MRKKLAIIMVSSMILMGTLPQTALTVCAEETQQEATVTTMYATANVNVRAGDSTSNKKIGSLTKGQAIASTGKTEKGWYVVDYNGQTGYVSGKYLTDNTAPAPKATASAPAPVQASTVAVGTTKTFSTGDTFEVIGTTPKGLPIWCLQGDQGMWPDYMIAAYDATGITNDMSDYDKAVAINNYICNTVDYAYDNGVDDRALYCACLSYGKAICGGYAHAFDCLCTMAGVWSNQVTGIANGMAHMWNYVLIGDTKYWVDVTWNDTNDNPNSYLMSTTLWDNHVYSYEKQ